MLRFTTYVTTSPHCSRRAASAAAHTRSKSAPRARNSVSTAARSSASSSAAEEESSEIGSPRSATAAIAAPREANRAMAASIPGDAATPTSPRGAKIAPSTPITFFARGRRTRRQGRRSSEPSARSGFEASDSPAVDSCAPSVFIIISTSSSSFAASARPGHHSDARESPSPSAAALTCGATSASTHSSSAPPTTYEGCAPSLGTSEYPSSAVTAASSARCGHGASGETWSGVTPGDTPPQSETPARSNRRHPSRPPKSPKSPSSPSSRRTRASSGSGVRFGGTCTTACGPKMSRAVAAVHRSSSSVGSG